MKNVPAVEAALQTDRAIKAIPEVVIEWDMNRYVGAVASSNLPTDVYDYDVEIFPIESIAQPNRPTKGINKARVGSATISDDYFTTPKSTPNGKFYVADPDDVYTYWTSPTPSNASTGALTNCKPQIIYNAVATTNKIVITFENCWASPKTFSVQTTTAANPTEGNWTEIVNQTSAGNGWKGSGQLILYWNGSTWVTTGRVDNADKTPKTTTLRGIRIVVTALEGGYQIREDNAAVASTYSHYVNGVYTTANTTGKDAYFDLIGISARLEADLSSHVIDMDYAGDLSEVSQMYPIGTLTSNQGNINLSNLYKTGNNWTPGLFSRNNLESPYHDFIDANAKVIGQYRYFDEDGVELDVVQEFVGYSDDWKNQSTDTVALEFSDYSKFFNDVPCPAAMWLNLTVPEIVWRILDSIGFVDYHIDQDDDRVTEHRIPVFYTDGESMVWEVLDELAKAAQAAIYFDSFGVLQVKTRDFAYSQADVPVWNFSSEDGPGEVANIIEATVADEFEPNHYVISYQKTDWSDDNGGASPTMEKVWEPEATEVIRSTPLAKKLNLADTVIYLDPKDSRVWPFQGMVNIQGELIRYKGKEFVYFTGAGGNTRNVAWVDSEDAKSKKNSLTPFQHRHKNHYTGGLKITEREVWNTESVVHSVDASGYSVRHIVNGTRRTGVAGFNHQRLESRVTLNTPKRFNDYKDILVATKGDTDDTAFYHYGTTMKFLPGAGNKDQRAGLLLHSSGTSEDGYYIEFTVSKNLGGKERKDRNELILYSRVNGKDHRIGGDGRALAIAEGIDYEIDVTWANVGNDHKITVFFNGKQALRRTISGANKNAANGRFGLFARGQTKAEFEYLYAVRREPEYDPDDFSFMHKVKGGYVGQRFQREWVFKEKPNSRRVRKKTGDPKHRVNQMFMDDFGPYVHEVREYDVKFEPAPVLHSFVYNTNDWSTAVLDYNATPFGATFAIANIERYNAVVNGDDSMVFRGTNQSVSQVLTVFGRVLITEDAEEVIAKDDDQIRRRGKIEAEISSPWIQSKAMAQDIADWMRDNFSSGNETINLEVFGNPLIEVSDIVNVSYPDKHIDGDYFVIAVKNEFDEGVRTTLTLRRRST